MLDVDRLAEAMLSGVKALMAKELAPLRAENEALRGENAALVKRLGAVEAREIPPAFDPSEIIGMIKAIDVPELPELPELPDIGAMVKAAVAELPCAKDGKDGIDGKDGLPGRDGRDGAPGKDGLHGKDGAPGIDGKDGLGFDDLSVDFDGERGLVLRFVRGEQVKEFSLRLPVPIDRGVWKEAGSYERGDLVTWAGSVWIAQKDAPEGKPEQTADWRLAVKRGRDAKPQVKP